MDAVAIGREDFAAIDAGARGQHSGHADGVVGDAGRDGRGVGRSYRRDLVGGPVGHGNPGAGEERHHGVQCRERTGHLIPGLPIGADDRSGEDPQDRALGRRCQLIARARGD